MHKNKINNKIYIGQTCRDNIEKRWLNGNGYKCQSIFYADIVKYGWNNFEHIILQDNIKHLEEANKFEIYYIKYYDSIKYGYNILTGGQTDNTYGNNPNSKKIICDNVIYNSVLEFSEKYNLNYNNVLRWLNKIRYMPKKYIDLGLRFLNDNSTVYEPYTTIKYSMSKIGKYKNGDNPNARPVMCNGEIFDTIRNFSFAYNEREADVARWLNKTLNMPEKYIKLDLRYVGDIYTIYSPQLRHKTKVECEGILFNSIVDCARYYNMERQKKNMSNWLSGKIKMPKEWIEKGLKKI